MTFNDVPVLASLSGRALLAVGLIGIAVAIGVAAALRLRRRRATPALRPLPREWHRQVVIAAPRARDLVKGTGHRSAQGRSS